MVSTDGLLGIDTTEDIIERLFRDGFVNAVISWMLIAVLVSVFIESLLDFDRQWIVFVAASGAIALVPPVVYHEWRVMLPWELLVLALLPILVRGLFAGQVGIFAVYFSIASLALIITVELHMFTPLEVTHWFAVAFVVLTTMASVAAWAIVRWTMDRFFGTAYLSTNEVLMVEFLWVTLAGVVAGVVFDGYFRRRDRQLRRMLRRVISR